MRFSLSAIMLAAILGIGVPGTPAAIAQQTNDPFLALMKRADVHAKAHRDKFTPALSPEDTLLLGPNPAINVKTLHAAGFRVVPWTTNDPEKMKALIALGVDGLISDRPDLLQQVVTEERAAGHKLIGFDLEAHRGGRGLRPENTLPSFESGMDQGAVTLETDTGVTTDGISLIWHDQFLNPLSCRRQDGAPYTMENRVYVKDISMTDAQKTFICDKLRFGPSQKNDVGLSPVAEAFAAKEGLASPYVPTNAAQLFEFVRFYTAYYKSGPGKNTPGAKEHAAAGARVRFNLETKIMPEHVPEEVRDPSVPIAELTNHTVSPEIFVKTLCGEITKADMVDRSDVQSFDFRTLLLVQQQYPDIPTYYLSESVKLLSTVFVPEELRLTPEETK